MASLNYCNIFPIFYQIILLLMISYSPNILSQDPSSSSPTIAQCTSSLLPLIPCAPFVQGTAQSPGSQCCDSLKQLYIQEPHCLCLLLNDTTLSSFPINRTLALQLPPLCTLQVNISDCEHEQVQVPPTTSPDSQVSFGTKKNSTVVASPAFSVPPRPSMMGFGFGRNEAINLKTENGLAVVMTIAILLFTSVAY
ncbi:non-specific lipid transfer protein GPI-anchored 10 [Gastrolobium bilobum]|uniref:non-specific lipid transfer protein GPI-anchored 10 n=1 Tax=Gastrolobium bilobum TaxID=150636 RepID=UPI002AB006BB|nr:non-specific lipid transfer protein GPI-anchored 10 [Gastrolobium bilobum]